MLISNRTWTSAAAIASSANTLASRSPPPLRVYNDAASDHCRGREHPGRTE